MNLLDFKAVSLAREIDLNAVAAHFGIVRKFRWEEALLLSDKNLSGILPTAAGRTVWIFSFGSFVFCGCQTHEMHDILAYLQRLIPSLPVQGMLQYSDDYQLQLGSNEKLLVDGERLEVPALEEWQPEIVATVLAKSVALERVEAALAVALDVSEERIEKLEQGRFESSDRRLAQSAAAILRLEHGSVSYLMLLDKPDITWTNEAAHKLYLELSRTFELDERYQGVRHKTEVLKDIGSTFTSLAHAKRSTRLEWVVILLIAFEILMALVPHLWRILKSMFGF